MNESKHGWKKIVTIAGVIVVVMIALLSYLGSPGSATEEAYQANADEQRISHVHEIVDLIEQYKTITGTYPLETIYDDEPFLSNAEVQENRDKLAAIVFIHMDHEYTRQLHDQLSEEFSYIEVAPVNFYQELAAVLGDGIDVPVDPQKVANTTRPNVHKYQYVNGQYFVQANLYEPTEYTEKVDEYYYTYKVGRVDDGIGIRSTDDIE